ncbi:MAG TPA: hypothetical protein VM223_22815 [Planctomycetota bacterium]|nr:hypothetical protein [Planctomycetota bacterium]
MMNRRLRLLSQAILPPPPSHFDFNDYAFRSLLLRRRAGIAHACIMLLRQ